MSGKTQKDRPFDETTRDGSVTFLKMSFKWNDGDGPAVLWNERNRPQRFTTAYKIIGGIGGSLLSIVGGPVCGLAFGAVMAACTVAAEVSDKK